jgi:hypothetical protein
MKINNILVVAGAEVTAVMKVYKREQGSSDPWVFFSDVQVVFEPTSTEEFTDYLDFVYGISPGTVYEYTVLGCSAVETFPVAGEYDDCYWAAYDTQYALKHDEWYWYGCADGYPCGTYSPPPEPVSTYSGPSGTCEEGTADGAVDGAMAGKFFGYVDGYDECWIMGGCED